MQETADTDLLPLQLIEPYDINYKYILKNKNKGNLKNISD